MDKEQILRERIKASASNGKLSCPIAFKLAAELDCPVSEIGRLADELKIKIAGCQLGCF
ncbi:MAG: hypothetical protein ACOYBM_03020 [Dethiobacteria bacterium]|jgi:hypothetical protein|nr:hypothetical protein [Bacillota bacterium]